jgi:hypothetical protein
MSSDYFSFLLRVWRVRTDGDVVWRATLEDVSTGEKHGFGSLDALIEHLNHLGETPPAEAEEDK